MNKLIYNIPNQRTINDNYWFGGGMANNLVDPINGTLDCIEGDINQLSINLMDNLRQNQCTEKIGIEIDPKFQNIDGLLQQDNQENEQYFYHGDHLGSSSWITDASGNVNQYLAYMPFGE